MESVLKTALITLLVYVVSVTVSASSRGPKSPMVIGIIEEAQDTHIVVVTRDKFKRTLTFTDDSTIVYVGFDDAKKEIKAKCAFRASVKDEVIGTIYGTASTLK